MKINKNRLKQIIKEELSHVLQEVNAEDWSARYPEYWQELETILRGDEVSYALQQDERDNAFFPSDSNWDEDAYIKMTRQIFLAKHPRDWDAIKVANAWAYSKKGL